MTSNNQGFVKAFSRRNRSVANPTESQNPPRVTTSSEPVRREPVKPVSAEAAATWWIDEEEGNHYRADNDPKQVISKPHLEDDICLADARDEVIAEPEVIERDVAPQERVPSLQDTISSYSVGSTQDDQLASLYGNSISIAASTELEAPLVEPQPTGEEEVFSLKDVAKTSQRIDEPHVRFSIKPLKLRSKQTKPAVETVTDSQASEIVQDSESQSVADEPVLMSHAKAEQRIEEAIADQSAADIETRTQPQAELETETAVFRPAWEVDQFDLPSNVAKLFFHGEVFQHIAEQMLEAVETGLSTVLITSVHGEEGRSTVAMGVALAAAAAGIRVALVDGDTIQPTLVDDLCLDVEKGWLDAIRSGQPICSVAVHSVEDGVTLYPLFETDSSEQASPTEMKHLISTIKESFDLVIIDGPIGASPMAAACAEMVESAMVVCDVERTAPEEVAKLSDHLAALGVKGTGIVENFA
ncbi:CobQ/CobB/MinD/ParA nucleotide binding domain protein [Planctomycetes bacterium CA13]|uniref:CobQ/CobB/MinD/ParA nucleotide binding domain protein n=1 Tax=Novipirellula herctigrandis TaxID=2527986 RepID=A0A5C5Z6I8_9BACT|nr:CobQ/CobB/MinD/ParA nucleotide binding domain protein [Planctomycetes bacterium CA13]